MGWALLWVPPRVTKTARFELARKVGRNIVSCRTPASPVPCLGCKCNQDSKRIPKISSNEYLKFLASSSGRKG